MRLETDFSRRSKYTEKLHEKSATAWRTKHGKTSGQCGRKINHDPYETIDERIEYHDSGKYSSHERGRTRFKLKHRDTFEVWNGKFSRKRHRKQSQSSISYSSSSTDSAFRSDDSFCMGSKPILRCPHSTLKEMKNRSFQRNISCGCIHTSSTVHKHRYCHSCQKVKRHCCGLYSHHKKRTQHEQFSSALNGSSLKFRKRNGSPCRYGHYCHCQSSSTSEIFNLNPPGDTSCSQSTEEIKKKEVSAMRFCVNSGCFASAQCNVSGFSQNMSGWQDGIRASCMIAKSITSTQETEKQNHQDELLQLSLKAPERKKLTVEGFSKDDLKLSLPDGRNCFYYHESQNEELQQVGHNLRYIHPSCMRSSGSDPSLCNWQRENLHYFDGQQPLTSLPDLNLLPNLINWCNTYRREEPYSTVQDKINTQGNSDGPFKASSISGVAEYSNFRKVANVFSGDNDVLVDSRVDDSENKSSKQNMVQSLFGQKNDLGTCKKESVPQELLVNHKTHVLSEGNNLKGNVHPGNVLQTGMKDKVEDDINFMQPYSLQSTEISFQHNFLVAEWPADNCNTIDITSSEDKFSDKNIPHYNLSSSNTTLEESQENRRQEGLAVKGLENDTMAEENMTSGRSVDNYESFHSFGEGGCTGTFKSQEKDLSQKSDSVNNDGDIPTIHGNKEKLGAVEHSLSEPQHAEAVFHITITKTRMWDKGIICDLCGQGPSLTYGDWYAWCCGSRLFYCKCTEEHKRKLLLSMNRKVKSSKGWKGYQWSGKVHRMCGLWSSEVYEKDDSRDQLEGLLDAVRRGRFFNCAECKRFGATLGCRVKECKKTFHYPCANWLSTQLRCQIWEGYNFPVSCHYHRYVVDCDVTAEDTKRDIEKCRNNPDNAAKGNINASAYMETIIPEDQGSQQKIMVKDNPDMDRRDLTKAAAGGVDDVPISPHLCGFIKNQLNAADSTVSNKENLDLKCSGRRSKNEKATLCRKGHDRVKCLGQKLIYEDISNGTEVINIPCTNDIDDDAIPEFLYIPKNRFSKQATTILESVLSNMEKQAKACDGCDEFDVDDPDASISVHMHKNECRRDQDDRIDWQGEPMLGRLAYDCYGRLQLGEATPDVVECNSRCPCRSKCLNRRLQHGLQVGLEVFRTQDQRWGVRSLERIPRGKFVVEYVGELLTQDEANKRAEKNDNYNSRFLFSMDHPDDPREDQLVVDIFEMSNVARFISHSCAGNLSIYRVYTETLDYRIFQMGMYACRDIECGEELTYDYNYIPTKELGAST